MRWVVVMMAIGVAVSARAQAPAPGAGNSPEARATRRAYMQTLRQTDPVAFATARAKQRAARRSERGDKPPRDVVVASPLPLPVVPQLGGAPLGATCATGRTCTLTVAAPAGKVITVTAIWNANAVRCDGVELAAPPSGAPIAPWWRCERELVVEGAGAGYAAFAAGR